MPLTNLKKKRSNKKENNQKNKYRINAEIHKNRLNQV